MSRPPFTVVDRDKIPVAPPANVREALIEAADRAVAAGAIVFFLAYQIGDEAPTGVAYPNTKAVREGLSMAAFNQVHFPHGNIEFED